MATKYGEAAYKYWAKKKTRVNGILTAIAMVLFVALAYWYNAQ